MIHVQMLRSEGLGFYNLHARCPDAYPLGPAVHSWIIFYFQTLAVSTPGS